MSIVQALLGHDNVVFIERWSLDTSGLAGFTVSTKCCLRSLQIMYDLFQTQIASLWKDVHHFT